MNTISKVANFADAFCLPPKTMEVGCYFSGLAQSGPRTEMNKSVR